MNGALDPKTRINLEAAGVLLLEQSQHGLEVLTQIFLGFGVRQCYRSTTVEEAMEIVERRDLDLIVVDPNLKGDDGHGFVEWLRKAGRDPNRSAPVIVVSTNATKSAIARARDVGASFFVSKPLTPAVLIDRIVRVTRDKRAFIVCDTYSGPDRRFKFEGPPPGVAPRRSTDLNASIGEAKGPGMSQSDINAILKPQKVSL
jgi:CheY-like chemotaxis protein